MEGTIAVLALFALLLMIAGFVDAPVYGVLWIILFPAIILGIRAIVRKIVK